MGLESMEGMNRMRNVMERMLPLQPSDRDWSRNAISRDDTSMRSTTARGLSRNVPQQKAHTKV